MKTFLLLCAVVVVCMIAAPFVYCSPMLKSDRAGFTVKIQK